MILLLLATSALVLNEVLYDPPGADAGREFVELLNASPAAEPLAGLALEAGDGAHPGTWRVVWQGTTGTLEAGALLVIGGDSVATRQRLAADLQNGPDALRLTRGGVVLDRLGYGALTDTGMYEGHPAPDVASASLARTPDGRDTDDNAADFLAAVPTPGRRNVLRRNASLSVHAPDATQIRPGWPVHVTASVRNRGLDTLGATWDVRAELRGPCRAALDAAAAAADTWPVEVQWERRPLAVAESSAVEVSWTAADGVYRLALALPAADEDSTDDHAALWVRVGAGPVVVNEIQFAPDTGGSEWIELWNRDRVAVDLHGWTLEDASGRRSRFIGTPVLGPDQFAVVAADTQAVIEALSPGALRLGASPWNTLNNTDGEDGFADALVLRDGTGLVVDALRYAAAWGGEKGRSLERLMPDPDVRGLLWAPCKDAARATPGRVNSSTAPARSRTRLELSPNPFTPDGDGRNDLLVAVLEVPQGCVGMRLRVFDMQGRCRATLGDDRLGPGPRHLVWDGRAGDGILVSSGIYILDLELYTRAQGSSHVRQVVGVRRP